MALLSAYRRQTRSRAFCILLLRPSTGADTTEQLSFDYEWQPASRQQQWPTG